MLGISDQQNKEIGDQPKFQRLKHFVVNVKNGCILVLCSVRTLSAITIPLDVRREVTCFQTIKAREKKCSSESIPERNM